MSECCGPRYASPAEAIEGCCQTNEPKHQYSFDEYFYEVTNERHSVSAASRFSLNVLRFESCLGPLKLCHYLLTKGVTENGTETVFG